jgi:hypothetical protein
MSSQPVSTTTEVPANGHLSERGLSAQNNAQGAGSDLGKLTRQDRQSWGDAQEISTGAVISRARSLAALAHARGLHDLAHELDAGAVLLERLATAEA